jgi:hypothetical protein
MFTANGFDSRRLHHFLSIQTGSVSVRLLSLPLFRHVSHWRAPRPVTGWPPLENSCVMPNWYDVLSATTWAPPVSWLVPAEVCDRCSNEVMKVGVNAALDCRTP